MAKHEMLRKSFEAKVLETDEVTGVVSAVTNVFGIVDDAPGGGDIVHKGAFVKTINERFGRIRVLDNHNANSVMNVVGKPLEIRELNRSELPAEVQKAWPMATGGLYTKTQYAIDTPEGLGVFKRIAEGYINEYSIAFTIVKGKSDYSEVELPNGEKRTVRNIREVVLYEYSSVLWGMNPATFTQDVKSEDGPDEAKVVDETEDSIRVQIFKPGLCRDGTYRSKVLSEEQGITAGMCKKGDSDTMSVQTVIFKKSKGWTKATAVKWVEDHDLKGAAMNAKEMTPDGAQRRLGDVWKASVNGAHMNMCNQALAMGYISSEEHKTMMQAGMDMCDMMDEMMGEDMRNRPIGEPGGMMHMYGLFNDAAQNRSTVTGTEEHGAHAGVQPAAEPPNGALTEAQRKALLTEIQNVQRELQEVQHASTHPGSGYRHSDGEGEPTTG